MIKKILSGQRRLRTYKEDDGLAESSTEDGDDEESTSGEQLEPSVEFIPMKQDSSFGAT